MSDTLKKDDLVRLSPLGIERGIAKNHRGKLGMVTGFDRSFGSPIVIWSGMKVKYPYHPDFLTKVEA